jgi:putative zinc finger/helix-turn-helix YgiT family protein
MSTTHDQCPLCGGTCADVVVSRTTQVKYDGALYTVTVPDMRGQKCSSCEEITFTTQEHSRVYDALRAQLALLTPAQIRENRSSLGTQRAVGDLIGVAFESICRWEGGAVIQSRAMDNSLRAFFALPALRAFLAALKQNPALGTTVNWEPLGFRFLKSAARENALEKIKAANTEYALAA